MTEIERVRILSTFNRLQGFILFKLFDYKSLRDSNYKDYDFLKTLFGKRFRHCAKDVKFAIEMELRAVNLRTE